MELTMAEIPTKAEIAAITDADERKRARWRRNSALRRQRLARDPEHKAQERQRLQRVRRNAGAAPAYKPELKDPPSVSWAEKLYNEAFRTSSNRREGRRLGLAAVKACPHGSYELAWLPFQRAKKLMPSREARALVDAAIEAGVEPVIVARPDDGLIEVSVGQTTRGQLAEARKLKATGFDRAERRNRGAGASFKARVAAEQLETLAGLLEGWLGESGLPDARRMQLRNELNRARNALKQ